MDAKEQRPRRIVITGGGTGGHLYPALAIAEAIKRRAHNAEIVFIGTAGKIEARVVPCEGYRFETIWISGFRRTLSWSLLSFPLKLCVSIVQSFRLLRRFRPDVVVGTGGYVCGPPVFVASMLGIPTVLQEQNSYPGVTTRLLAKRANEVFLSFEKSRSFLPKGIKATIAGNPVRASVGGAARSEAAAFFGFVPSLKTVLVFGGSLGASSINAAVRTHLEKLVAGSTQLLWQTGERDFTMAEAVVKILSPEEQKRIKVLPFIDRMDLAFGASDVAVCRAGASTLAELALAGMPAILVPYPFAAADHQTENARAVAEQDAAIFCADKEIGAKLGELLTGLLNNDARRLDLSRNMRSLARPDAAAQIAEAVLGYAGYGHV